MRAQWRIVDVEHQAGQVGACAFEAIFGVKCNPRRHFGRFIEKACYLTEMTVDLLITPVNGIGRGHIFKQHLVWMFGNTLLHHLEKAVVCVLNDTEDNFSPSPPVLIGFQRLEECRFFGNVQEVKPESAWV